MKRSTFLKFLGGIPFFHYIAKAQEATPYLSSAVPTPTSETSVSKSLENILSEVILPPRDNLYSNGDRFVYNLFVYDKINVGNLTIKENSLEFNIRAFYFYKKHATLSNENDSTHVQTEDDDIYRQELSNGSWVLTYCNKKEKRKLIGSSLPGDTPVNLLNKLLSGEDVSYPKTFLFGIPYEGPISSEEGSFGYKRFKVDVTKFRLYEDAKWISLVDDPKVIFGDIVALFRDNKPLIIVGRFKPYISVWGIKILRLRETNLKMIREDIVSKNQTNQNI